MTAGEQQTGVASHPDIDDLDYEDSDCYECGGEGFISDCVEEWACIDPEYGCDYCTRRCPLCNAPSPTNPSNAD
jgi:hypothetical protein